MIIRLSSPLDFVYETRNQIQITGCLFTTDSSPLSNIKKQNLLVPALLYSTGGTPGGCPRYGVGRVEEMAGGRNKVLSVNAYETKSLPAHRHKELRFL